MLQTTNGKILSGCTMAGVLLAVSMTVPSYTAESISRGRDKAGVCAPCHGSDGNAVSSAFPRLASQHANYLSFALNSYRHGTREDAIMRGIAASLKDQDINDLASYFESLPGPLTTLPRK